MEQKCEGQKKVNERTKYSPFKTAAVTPIQRIRKLDRQVGIVSRTMLMTTVKAEHIIPATSVFCREEMCEQSVQAYKRYCGSASAHVWLHATKLAVERVAIRDGVMNTWCRRIEHGHAVHMLCSAGSTIPNH